MVVALNANAQTGYTVSGKILLTDSSYYDSGPFFITLRDNTGATVAGTIDSNLYFKITGVKQGVYQLSVDSLNFFKMHRCDTVITIDNESIYNAALKITPICEVFTKEKALRDIQVDSVLLIMEPGLVRFKFSRTEKRFQRKYHLSYFYSGCFRFTHYSCLKIYNKIIFNYLDNRYGVKWRQRLAANVVGFK